jgi:hypothetical protein
MGPQTDKHLPPNPFTGLPSMKKGVLYCGTSRNIQYLLWCCPLRADHNVVEGLVPVAISKNKPENNQVINTDWLSAVPCNVQILE